MHSIDIRLRDLAQLYDSLDPSPFHEKSLDRNAEAYLLESAGEYPANAPLQVLLHGPPELAAHLADIGAAVHRHFSVLLALAERRHRRRKRIGRNALLLGSIVLIGALALRSWVTQWPGAWGDVLAEGLLILAWVALWRPAEIALFDQWESRDHLRLLRKLTQMPVAWSIGSAGH